MEWSKKLLIFSLLSICLSCNIHNQKQGITLNSALELEDKKICVIGDTGTGSSHQYLVAKALEKENCEMLLHTGDLIYPKGIRKSDSKKLQTHFIKPYKNILLTTPTYIVMGNHDHKKNVTIWENIAKAYNNLNYPSAFYLAKFNQVCIFFIDTILNYRLGQDLWLKNEINKSSCERTIAVGHHPYISSGEHGNARGNIRKFLEENIVNNVELYIAGHDHNLSIEETGKHALQLVSGAGAKLRSVKKTTRTIKAISELGYAIINLKSTGFVIELKTVNFNGASSSKYIYDSREE